MSDQPQTTVTEFDREYARRAITLLPTIPCDTFENMQVWRIEHWVEPYAQAIAAARAEERERCARIAHDRGLKSHKDFRWLAEDIEAEIRNG